MKFKFTDLKKAINELNNVEELLEGKISLAVTRKKKELTEDFCNAIESINEAGNIDKISDFVFNFYNDNFTEEESEEVEEVEESVSEKDEIENEVEVVEELNEEIETDEDIVEKEEPEIDYNIADELSLDSTPDIKSDEAEKEPIEIDIVPEKKQKVKNKKGNIQSFSRIDSFCEAIKKGGNQNKLIDSSNNIYVDYGGSDNKKESAYIVKIGINILQKLDLLENKEGILKLK